MKKNDQPPLIKTLSTFDFVRLFLASSLPKAGYHPSDIQIYDYQKLCEWMKVPTVLFRPDYSYALVLENGNISMQFDRETKQIYAPAVLFVSTGQLISVRQVSTDISGTLVVLENDSLSHIFSEKDLLRILQIPRVISLNKQDNALVISICRLLLEEYKSDKAELRVLVALVQVLLYKLLRHSAVSDVLSRKHLVALKFKELVYNNFVTEKHVSFYTGILDVSENYLNRCTSLVFSMTAKRFILEVAIMQSKLLLQDVQKGVAQVAYELNFEDSSYFSRIFRKITGITPSAYKQQSVLTNNIVS